MTVGLFGLTQRHREVRAKGPRLFTVWMLRREIGSHSKRRERQVCQRAAGGLDVDGVLKVLHRRRELACLEALSSLNELRPGVEQLRANLELIHRRARLRLLTRRHLFTPLAMERVLPGFDQRSVGTRHSSPEALHVWVQTRLEVYRSRR